MAATSDCSLISWKPTKSEGSPTNSCLQGDGAWEPKVKEKGGPRAGPGRGRKRKNAELAATQTTSDEEEISDEDEEGDAKPVAAPAESRPASSSARQKPQARKDDEPVAPAAAAEALQGADAEAAEPAAGESGARRGRRPSGKRARVPGAEQDAAGESMANDTRPPGIQGLVTVRSGIVGDSHSWNYNIVTVDGSETGFSRLQDLQRQSKLIWASQWQLARRASQ